MNCIHILLDSPVTNIKSTMEVELTDTIPILFEKISKKFGYALEHTYYIRRGKCLEPSSKGSLEELGFEDYDFISVRWRMRSLTGCPQCGPNATSEHKH